MWGWKQIAVFIDLSLESEALARRAAGIARKHDAHLIGVVGLPHDHPGQTSEAFARGREAIAGVLARRQRVDQQRVDVAASRLSGLMRDQGVAHDFVPVWSDAFDLGALHLLQADLIVAAHPRPRDLPEGWSAERIVLNNGGPLLLVPEAWRGEALGERVMIAWNGSRQARRAVRDALPMLDVAAEVTILTIDAPRDPSGAHDAGGLALRDYLAKRGIAAAIHDTGSRGRPVAEVITAQALEVGADVTVIGAYSHSRAAEFLFGGVTRTLLAETHQPLLISN